MAKKFHIVIIGAGILGASLAYFLAHLNPAKKIAVIEQAPRVAFHTSGRNTGKIHAPYLYDPEKKRLFARAAFCGFEMWETYSKLHSLPFKRDGVIEVASNEDGARILEKYARWGVKNGLEEGDIELLDGAQLQKIEPNVRGSSAIYCRRDGSADYAAYTGALMADAKKMGAVLILNTRVAGIERNGHTWSIMLDEGYGVEADFLINAAGGAAMDIAHQAGVAGGLVDVHFRGEYWVAPDRYNKLTSTSVYSVPDFPEYPFLDPHWIIRVDGRCEIGPNAVPVFSPYGYDTSENIKKFLPKTLEMLGSGARKAIFDKQFQELAVSEAWSSVSKNAMVERVRKFLPSIDAGAITKRGTAGIRSSVIDADGKFVPDAILKSDQYSLHILNYNSPGATGALPFSAHVINMLEKDGLLKNEDADAQCGPWKFGDIVGEMTETA